MKIYLVEWLKRDGKPYKRRSFDGYLYDTREEAQEQIDNGFPSCPTRIVSAEVEEPK